MPSCAKVAGMLRDKPIRALSTDQSFATASRCVHGQLMREIAGLAIPKVQTGSGGSLALG